MTKTALIVLASIASVAAADINFDAIDRSGYSIYTGQATALESSNTNRGAAPLYDNQAGPYQAFPPSAVNPIGVGDYQSVATNNIDVSEFVFVGGVNTAGSVVFFDFFDAGGNFLDGFGVALPQAGNFIWTITTTDLEIAADGIVSMDVDDGTNGPAGLAQWFLTAGAAAVGNAGIADFANGPDSFNFAFAISGTEIPAPGAIALLGLGGAVATRRRR